MAINNELPSLDWSIWKEIFTYKQTEIDNLRKIEELEENTVKFAEIISQYNSGFEILSDSEITNLKQININKKSAMIIELKN